MFLVDPVVDEGSILDGDFPSPEFGEAAIAETIGKDKLIFGELEWEDVDWKFGLGFERKRRRGSEGRRYSTARINTSSAL